MRSISVSRSGLVVASLLVGLLGLISGVAAFRASNGGNVFGPMGSLSFTSVSIVGLCAVALLLLAGLLAIVYKYTIHDTRKNPILPAVEHWHAVANGTYISELYNINYDPNADRVGRTLPTWAAVTCLISIMPSSAIFIFGVVSCAVSASNAPLGFWECTRGGMALGIAMSVVGFVLFAAALIVPLVYISTPHVNDERTAGLRLIKQPPQHSVPNEHMIPPPKHPVEVSEYGVGPALAQAVAGNAVTVSEARVG